MPEGWGDWATRAINWETLTAAALVESGADIIVLRHPESIRRVKKMIAALDARRGIGRKVMALSGLDIYKLLPGSSKDPAVKAHANCKECGFPTCLAFAMKLAAKQVELSQCP